MQGRCEVFWSGTATGKDIVWRCIVSMKTTWSRKNFFTFIFQLCGWALVAPSCFTATGFCGFHDRLALDMEGTCELAERFDLVHHIPEAAISDWYTKEPVQRSFCLELKDNRVWSTHKILWYIHRSQRTVPAASCCRSCWYWPLHAHMQAYRALYSYLGLGMPKSGLAKIGLAGLVLPPPCIGPAE